MAGRLPIPTEISRLGMRVVRIAWDDGHRADYGNGYLRQHCPCAQCRERSGHTLPVVGGQAGEIYPVQIGLVGRYAVSVQWSDGHDTGIYSYRMLRELCPCEQCRAARKEAAS